MTWKRFKNKSTYEEEFLTAVYMISHKDYTVYAHKYEFKSSDLMSNSQMKGY